MRNMSFAMTTEQVRRQTKTVTRRVGWRFLKRGDLMQPVVKCQGLKKGEGVTKIGGPIRVVSVCQQRLGEILPQDVYREGFPSMTVADFVRMFKKAHPGVRVDTEVTRIQFEYTELAGIAPAAAPSQESKR